MASTLAPPSVMRLDSRSLAMIVAEKAARNSRPSGAIASPAKQSSPVSLVMRGSRLRGPQRA